MLRELSRINLCVPELIVTYDMGIQFCVITSEGVSDSIGNIGSWPNIKYKVNPEMLSLHEALSRGDEVTDDKMMKVPDIKSICSYSDMTGCYDLGEDAQKECLALLRKELLNIQFTNEYYYVYAYIENWEKNIRLFDTIEELTEYFKQVWASDCRPYEEMDDDELECYYNQAKEAGWNHLPLFIDNDE